MAVRDILQAAAGSSGVAYVEDVFSTYLYTGNGSTQTITNSIDLSGKGGMVWMKSRSVSGAHAFYDTARGATFDLVSNSTAAQTTQATGLTAFNSNGFSIGALAKINGSGNTHASWTFRKQTKFFDVVTYTGNGANRTIAHSLGSVPGCIIVKQLDNTSNWNVYHRGLTSAANTIRLDLANAQASQPTYWNSTAPTASEFSLGTSSQTNASGGTYVAYLFAHDAGGFGVSGSDNIISCGTYLGSNHRAEEVVPVGFEPQFVLIKNISSGTTNWVLVDNMRSMASTGGNAWLLANTSGSETAVLSDRVVASPTGFFFIGPEADINESGSTFIYIAIRRPMKPPVTGADVLEIVSRTGTGSSTTVGTAFTADAFFAKNRGALASAIWADRLRGAPYVLTNATNAETTATTVLQTNPWDTQTGVKVGTTSSFTNASSNTFINYLWRREPGVFDVVCYTGTGANTTISHNLTVAPELIILKQRSSTQAWTVGATGIGWGDRAVLNTNAAEVADSTAWNSTAPTSSVFSVGTSAATNASAATYVAYLFATMAGISKVGTYTGNGSTQTIDCGFAAGARFVLIKRTDSTGSWYVWDSVRGIISGNDPYFAVESGAAEVTSNDSLTVQSSGFGVSQNATTNINVNAATYLYLAIA